MPSFPWFPPDSPPEESALRSDASKGMVPAEEEGFSPALIARSEEGLSERAEEEEEGFGRGSSLG